MSQATLDRSGLAPLVAQKLDAFEQLRPEFEACFLYVQEMHGQRRFGALAVGEIVRYLHALWVCDCKDALLSVPRTIERYDGWRALDLLDGWQRGETAAVIDFLEQKLDMCPFASLTRQIEQAQRAKNDALAHRLAHGRNILLNRAWNLHKALSTLFAFAPDALTHAVGVECRLAGHSSEAVAEQRATRQRSEYAYHPYPLLARTNMVLMNSLGVRATDNRADRPGRRTARVGLPAAPIRSYAEAPIDHATEFTPPPNSTWPYVFAAASLPAPPDSEEMLR